MATVSDRQNNSTVNVCPAKTSLSTVLMKPTEDFLRQIKDMMFKFLWNSQPDKTARNINIQEY